MKTQTQTVRCTRNVDYVTAGETYTVERGRTPKHDAHFRNNRTGGATFMREWQVRAAITAGHFVVEG